MQIQQVHNRIFPSNRTTARFGYRLEHSTYLDHERWAVKPMTIGHIWDTFSAENPQSPCPKGFTPLYVAYKVTRNDILGDQYFNQTGSRLSPVWDTERRLDNLRSPSLALRPTGETVSHNRLVPAILRKGLRQLTQFARRQHIQPNADTTGFIVFEGADQVLVNLVPKLRQAIEEQVIPGTSVDDFKRAGASIILRVPHLERRLGKPSGILSGLWSLALKPFAK